MNNDNSQKRTFLDKRQLVGWLSCLTVAFVLVLAGYSKIYGFDLWAADVAAHKFLGKSAGFISIIVPIMEMTLGYILIISPKRHEYAKICLALFGFFLLYQIGRGWKGEAWGFPATTTCKCLKLPATLEFAPTIRNSVFLLVAGIWVWIAPRSEDSKIQQ